MFTGIVEQLGTIVKIEHKTNLCILSVKSSLRNVRKGDSVCVSGVCLTAVKIVSDILTFDIMLETLTHTSLGALRVGDQVNLERALKADSRFGGHFVTGHVDQIVRLQKRIERANYVEFQISHSKKISKFIVPKGSICIDGVSLTVGEVRKEYFSVYLIPHTLKVTTLGKKKIQDPLNIEVDIVARYILQSKLK